MVLYKDLTYIEKATFDTIDDYLLKLSDSKEKINKESIIKILKVLINKYFQF